MVDFEYLYQGLCGLARAHRAGTMAGHLGAAVVAGYFFGEDQGDLPEGVYRGVEGELKRVIAGEEAIWFNAKKVGIEPTELFKPLPKEPRRADAARSIAAALEKNIGSLRQSGHNVIFAALAIRALHDHPDYGAPQIVGGIRKLILAFSSVPPGRGYYGKAKGWLSGDKVKLPAEALLARYKSIQAMADATIAQLIGGAAIRKQGFGGLWHIINHAAALAELDRFGHKDLARRGLAAHHHHVRLWRSLPNVEKELGAPRKASLDPRKPAYWQGMLKRDEARLTHRIKTLYGYFVLRRMIQDAAMRKRADSNLLYLMG